MNVEGTRPDNKLMSISPKTVPCDFEEVDPNRNNRHNGIAVGCTTAKALDHVRESKVGIVKSRSSVNGSSNRYKVFEENDIELQSEGKRV